MPAKQEVPLRVDLDAGYKLTRVVDLVHERVGLFEVELAVALLEEADLEVGFLHFVVSCFVEELIVALLVAQVERVYLGLVLLVHEERSVENLLVVSAVLGLRVDGVVDRAPAAENIRVREAEKHIRVFVL